MIKRYLANPTFTLVLICLFFLTGILEARAQAALQHIVPMSPDAASLTRYGNIPVSLYTGIPEIAIPLYEVVSGDLNLPLALSYHAGGNKVETIPSWVGLGWSLSGIPVITRSVRGKPDSGSPFFYGWGNYTVAELYQDRLAYPERFRNFLIDVVNGVVDSEADIFYYNLPGASGKFYYDQELERFVCFPRANIQISTTGGGTGFILVDENGVRYHFDVTELTNTSTTGPTSSVYTAWYPSLIINAQSTDTVSISYGLQNITSSSTLGRERYQFIAGACSSPLPSDPPTSAVTSTIGWRRPERISFQGGYLDLVAASSERQDLIGGRALSQIRIHRSDGSLVKRYELLHGYFTGSGCGGSSYENKWLYLSGMREHAVEGSAYHEHAFSYHTDHIPPCRNSAAQDFWGYYNGAHSNTSLIPQAVLPGSSPPVVIPGANREVNPVYTQFGMLKKITYPTGGHTEFVYQNNQVKQGSPYNYKPASSALLGETPITTNTYTRNFVIDNPTDSYLNGNHVDGGAFIAASIGNLGCELDGMANPCAVLTIERITPGTPVYILVTSDFDGYYVPNGTYKMTATFDQDPAGYENYWFSVNWKERDPLPTGNQFAGGLRIGDVRDYDPVGLLNMSRYYSYVTHFGSSVSSGMLHAADELNYSELVTHYNQDCHDLYFRLVSYSTQEQTSHSGSYVGYGSVILESVSADSTGLSRYVYSQQPDLPVSWQSPYPPPHSMETYRGNLLSAVDYRMHAGLRFPVRSSVYEYLQYDMPQDDNLMLKVAPNPGLASFEFGMTFGDYTIHSVWSGVSKVIIRDYDQTDTTRYLERSTDYTYHALRHQLISESTLAGDGETYQTQYAYAPDLSLSGWAETARQWLVARNVLSPTLRRQEYVGSLLTAEQITDYRVFATPDLVLPGQIRDKSHHGQQDRTLHLSSYTEKGRLSSQYLEGESVVSYLWDETHSHPVARAEHAELIDIAFTSFEDSAHSQWSYTGTASAEATAVTGRYAYDLLQGPVVKSGLTPGRKYVLTYWVKGNVAATVSGGSTIAALSGTIRSHNGWTQYRRTFTGASSVSISGHTMIDHVQLHPLEANMHTYTYNDLVGMESMTDPSGNTHYYTYDRFRRLHSVWDLDGHLIQYFCYNHAGQLVDCNPYTDPPPAPPLPPSTEFTYLYSISQMELCDQDPGTLIPLVTVYLRTDNNLYYSDAACTVLVPNGYYRAPGDPIYRYIAAGAVSFTDNCP